MAAPISQEHQEKIVFMKGISKSFPGVLANNAIDFSIYKSEIHALLGENGAGKSTLMKILYGFYGADSGEIIYAGKPVKVNSPQDALKLRIGMVFQDLNLIPAMTVTENIALFLTDLPFIYKKQEIQDRILELSKRYQLEIDPGVLVSDLSIGQQQKVEILKLLMSQARILILDEPTRVLAPHEVDALFKILKRLRDDGFAIVMITHKMKEVMACAERITVLRKGQVTGNLTRSDASESKLISLMFGKQIPDLEMVESAAKEFTDAPLLELVEVSTVGEGATTSLSNISLKIHSKEIVGVAGVSGNGQKELGDLVLGMIQPSSGKMFLKSQDLSRLSIRELRRQGLAFIPEHPLAMALVPYMSNLENFTLTRTKNYERNLGLRMDWEKAEEDLKESLNALGFEFPIYTPSKTLSGGNLQRLVLARELSHQPNLIVASYPTQGLDVQSTLAARKALFSARDMGSGILLISEDLEEIFMMSDRIIVLYQGKITGSFVPSQTDIYEVGHLMTGSEVFYAE